MRAKDIRHQAWSALRGNWGWAILTCLVATILGGASAFASSGFSVNINFEGSSGRNEGLSSLTKFFEDSTIAPLIIGIIVASVVVITLISLLSLAYAVASFCLASIIEVGYSQFNLDIIDGNKVEFVRIFSFFKHWGKAVLANLIRNLFIFLWSLLFIIPGIIASYRYSMVPFILADNPNMSAGDAIDESKYLMHGNKWRLFCLQFSFFGWDVLCALTFGILSIWIVPYKHAALAAFYRSIVPAPVEEQNEEVNGETTFI